MDTSDSKILHVKSKLGVKTSPKFHVTAFLSAKPEAAILSPGIVIPTYPYPHASFSLLKKMDTLFRIGALHSFH